MSDGVGDDAPLKKPVIPSTSLTRLAMEKYESILAPIVGLLSGSRERPFGLKWAL